jgi:hypothetical protein
MEVREHAARKLMRWEGGRGGGPGGGEGEDETSMTYLRPTQIWIPDSS